MTTERQRCLRLLDGFAWSHLEDRDLPSELQSGPPAAVQLPDPGRLPARGRPGRCGTSAEERYTAVRSQLLAEGLGSAGLTSADLQLVGTLTSAWQRLP